MSRIQNVIIKANILGQDLMAIVTLEIPDELLPQLQQLGNRLPEWLALNLQAPAIPARLYREILEFFTTNPDHEQILNFQPHPEIQTRLRELLDRNKADELTAAEQAELDEYENIEHFMIMLKTRSLKSLNYVS
jgi:hypothetical protein